MIKADELNKIEQLTSLDFKILKQAINGHKHTSVYYLFEDYSPEAIEVTKQLLEDSGYSVNEITIHADYNQVGIMLDIFW